MKKLLTLLILSFGFIPHYAHAGGYNGSGAYLRYYNWTNDAANGINITASRFDTEDGGFATALSSVIVKDGQQTTTARIPFAVGLSIDQGNATTPGFSITGDTSTGIYQSVAGAIDITSSGTRIGGFDANGLDNTPIGVGTASTGAFTTATFTTATAATLLASGSVGIGTSSPLYLLDARNAAVTSQIHLNSAVTDVGGYITGFSTNGLGLEGGSSVVAGVATAKATAASEITLGSGLITFSADTGLSIGSTFTPTEVARISKLGVAIGTTALAGTSSPLQVGGRIGAVSGSADPGDGSAKGAWMFYDKSNAYGGINCIQTGVTTCPLNLQPSGGNVGIGSGSPRSIFDLSQSTDAVTLPVGTTTQRPAAPVNGMVRYNSTLTNVEAYANNAWASFMSSCTQVNSGTTTSSCSAGYSMTGGGCTSCSGNLTGSGPASATSWTCGSSGGGCQAVAICCH